MDSVLCLQQIEHRPVSPVEYVIGAARALELFDPPSSTLVLAEWCGRLGQDLFYPPNVGGWPSGRSWLTTRSVIGRANYAAALVEGDADESYDFSALEPFLARLRGGDDLVVGNRFRGGIKPGAMPWMHRYIGNPILSGLMNLFFHTPVHDAHCGLRAIGRAAYRRLGLQTTGMEFASEMVVMGKLRGLRMSEVPVTLYCDGRGRRSHLRSFRDGWRHVALLLVLCPLWLFLIPGVAMAAASLAMIVWYLSGPRGPTDAVSDTYVVPISGMVTVVACQLLWHWAYAVKIRSRRGNVSGNRRVDRLVERITLERGVGAGVALAVLGVGLNAWAGTMAVYSDGAHRDVQWMTWCQSGLGCTAMALSCQMICGGFFLRMLAVLLPDLGGNENDREG